MTLITIKDFTCSRALLGWLSTVAQKMLHNKSVKSAKKKKQNKACSAAWKGGGLGGGGAALERARAEAN